VDTRNLALVIERARSDLHGGLQGSPLL